MYGVRACASAKTTLPSVTSIHSPSSQFSPSTIFALSPTLAPCVWSVNSFGTLAMMIESGFVAAKLSTLFDTKLPSTNGFAQLANW